MTSPTPGAKKVDIHIHLVGGEEEGCYVSKSLMGSPWAKLLARWLGPAGTPQGYVRQLVAFIKESPLDVGVVLALDAIFDERGEFDPRTQFYVPNDYALRVARQHDELLAGVSIHPHRRDALEELERCIELGAVLVKWLPNSQGIDPCHARHIPFYRKLADRGMPLLTHTGYEFSFGSIKQSFGEPKRLRLALEEGVTVIAAHCAVSYGGLLARYLKDWLSLIRTYPNLYGDLAALSFGLGGKWLKMLLRDKVARERLVNGSDFPVPPLERRRGPVPKGEPSGSRL